MQYFKYYAFAVLCFSYCRFVFCSTSNENVVEPNISGSPDSSGILPDVSDTPEVSAIFSDVTGTPDASGILPDVSNTPEVSAIFSYVTGTPDASAILSSINDTPDSSAIVSDIPNAIAADDTVTDTVEISNKKSSLQKIVKKPVDYRLPIVLGVSFVVVTMLICIYKRLFIYPISPVVIPKEFKEFQLVDLPPVNFSYYGAKAPTLPQPDEKQKKAIEEIKELISYVTPPLDRSGKLNLGTARPLVPLDPSIVESWKDLKLEGRLMGEYPARTYTVTSNITNKRFEIRIPNRLDEGSPKNIIDNEKAFVARLFAEDKTCTDPFEKSAIMGQSLPLAEFDGLIHPILGAVPCKAFIYDGKPANVYEVLKVSKDRKLLSMEAREFLAGRIVLAALHVAKSGHCHNGIKLKNVWVDEEGNVQLCGLQGVEVAGEMGNIAFDRKTTCEPERFLIHFNEESHLHPADPVADLYSVGHTLYFLFTGEYLFGRCLKGKDTVVGYFKNLVENNPEFDTSKLEAAGVPEQWKELIKELLANRRVDRIKHHEIVQKYGDLLGLNPKP